MHWDCSVSDIYTEVKHFNKEKMHLKKIVNAFTNSLFQLRDQNEQKKTIRKCTQMNRIQSLYFNLNFKISKMDVIK